ncbi:tyrosine-type recombinase/integrase [Nitrospira tepida]|uniref:tyrosine-type recombinase/integrase n=1 Tax=Nitrospira tepida TaxID=2973512 RepID=UPI00351E2D20
MARAGRKDRGLLSKQDAAGKTIWYVRLYHDGRERRFGSFSTKTAARDFYEKAKQEQKAGRFFPERYQHGGYPLMTDLITAHVETSTVKNQWAEKHYGEWWKARLQGLRVNAVTPALLEAAQRELLTENLDPKHEATPVTRAPQTVLHYMKFLRHVLNKAKRDGRIDRNPFERVTLVKIRPSRMRFLTPEEEATLLDKLGPDHAPWARLAILTGLRLGEQMRLRWRDVNLDLGLLTLPETKAGGVQYVHLPEEARQILANMKAIAEARAIAHPKRASPWVFPSENPARPMDQRNVYSRIFCPAVRDAGLLDVRWHDLRHTFASRLAMAGHNEGTIAALLRHSSTALVKRYAHLSQAHLKAAVETVGRFGLFSPTPSQPSADRLLSGTVTETGTEVRESEERVTEPVEKLERAMGFEPTTTSLGS